MFTIHPALLVLRGTRMEGVPEKRESTQSKGPRIKLRWSVPRSSIHRESSHCLKFRLRTRLAIKQQQERQHLTGQTTLFLSITSTSSSLSGFSSNHIKKTNTQKRSPLSLFKINNSYQGERQKSQSIWSNFLFWNPKFNPWGKKCPLPFNSLKSGDTSFWSILLFKEKIKRWTIVPLAWNRVWTCTRDNSSLITSHTPFSLPFHRTIFTDVIQNKHLSKLNVGACLQISLLT